MSTPKTINPVLDATGEFASVNQPCEFVWFLAGKLGDGQINIPKRSCRIPKSRSILFPVINCEANCIEYPELTTELDVLDKVSRDEDTIILKECIVDSKQIPAQRIKSDPIIFDLTIAKENACEIAGGKSIPAAADGYWVFLKPLKCGIHSIEFRGSCENGRLFSGANYVLHVE